MTIFPVPYQAQSTSLFSVARTVFGDFSELPESVVIDFSGLHFCPPPGVVFLSNLTRFLLRNDVHVSWHGLDVGKQAIRYLDDSLFFKQHIGKSLVEGASPRSTTRPLVEVRHTHSHGWIASDLIPWLQNCSGLPNEAFAEFRTCMSELFNNISDHTELDVGSTFAQWYPNANRLHLAVADFGRGIPAAVRTVEPEHDDPAAIVRAFDEGFSSKSLPTNRGAGLSFLRQNVIENLGGSLRVSSGAGSVRYYKSGNSLRKQLYPDQGYCPGTMIEFDMRTDQIDFEDLGMVDFEWI